MRHRPPAAPQDGNAAILGMFGSSKELAPIAEQYITGTNAIEWKEYLRSIGAEAVAIHGATRLVVKQKLSSRQKKLLDKLGYNNWRKLSQGNK